MDITRHSSWWRRAISIALAQFIALQLVLSAAIAVQMVAPTPVDAATICSDSHSGTPGNGGQSNAVLHDGLCAVCAFVAHATPLPAPVAVHYQRQSTALALHPDLPAVAAISRQHDPRTSQGPPLSA